MTFEELIQLHQTHMQGLRRHRSTIYNHFYVQGVFSKYCLAEFGFTDPRSVESKHVSAYYAHLKGLPLSQHVKYSRQRLLKTWFAWATYQGHLFIDPSKDFVWTCPPNFPRGAPTEAEVMKLMETADDSRMGLRDRALMEFLYGTGLRIGECVAVNLSDLDFERRQVFVRNGKGGRQRTVPLGPNLVKRLQDYIRDVRPLFRNAVGDALWPTRRSQRLGPVHANGRIHHWSVKAGLKLSAHSFRHAYATHLLARGASIVLIQRLLGHADLGMATRYTHLVPLDVQKAIQEHHPRAKRKRKRKELQQDDGSDDEE